MAQSAPTKIHFVNQREYSPLLTSTRNSLLPLLTSTRNSLSPLLMSTRNSPSRNKRHLNILFLGVTNKSKINPYSLIAFVSKIHLATNKSLRS